MENKTNIIVILLVILIGVVSGVGLLIGINNAVGNAVRPMEARLNEIESMQISIEKKVNELANGKTQDSLSSIQRDLNQIQNKLNNIGSGGAPQAPQPPPEDMNKIYDIPVGVTPILGKSDAPITITMFSDFQCPFCNRFYPVVKDVLAAYPNQVRVMIKDFPLPFHPNARPAAKLAWAANEQGKFQGMMEALLANGGDVSDDKIKEYAKSLGLDYNKLISDYKNKDAQWEKQIQDDLQLGNNVDVRGTPTFYLNGRKTNSRDLSSFKAEIDAILAAKK